MNDVGKDHESCKKPVADEMNSGMVFSAILVKPSFELLISNAAIIGYCDP